MSKSQDPDHFFQTSHSLAETSRKAAKSSNENGAPIRLKSKILAIISDPSHPSAIYIAESAGQARRILLDVGMHVVSIPAIFKLVVYTHEHN